MAAQLACHTAAASPGSSLSLSLPCMHRRDGDGLCWEVELLPDAAKNNFTHWTGLLIHKGGLRAVMPCNLCKQTLYPMPYALYYKS